MDSSEDLRQVIPPVVSALQRGEIAQAMALAGRAVGRGVEHPLLLHLTGDQRLSARRPGEALPLLEKAAAMSPDDAAIRLSLGRALLAVNRREDALAAIDTALILQPDFPAAQFERGHALFSVDPDAARDCYEAAARGSGSAETWAILAMISAGQGDAAATRLEANQALSSEPNNGSALTALAAADILDGDFPAAESRLTDLARDDTASPATRGLRCKLLGDALHGLRRPEDAVAAWLDGNRWLVDDFRASTGVLPGAGLRPVRQLAELMRSADPVPWRRPPGPDTVAPGGGHAFLVGFPRSGTTLLGKALGRHPRVLELEERPTLAAPLSSMLQDPAELQRLPTLDADALDEMRRLYWQRVAEFAREPIDGRLVLDKMPLNLLLLPLISRLFPDAHILFALRDPRDVVLSCFRQRFKLTPAMAEFVTPKHAAYFYDAVMSSASACFERLPLDLHQSRYEDLVDDFDGRVATLLEALDLPWSDEVRDFARPAGRQVRTPSGRQLRRGLYRDGVGQWRLYQPVLGEVFASLQPWVRRFGYAVD